MALVVAAVFGGLTVKHELHQRACNRYQALVFKALGDGLEHPAPSTAGLSAHDAALVAAWRASFQRQIDTATAAAKPGQLPHGLQVLSGIWHQEMQGSVAVQVMGPRGCTEDIPGG
ncbi:MAG TPA: hypothetical protein VMU09_07340 [Acidimicrobiales bacterium]|nr:hypothetical protein [Acidimicrobiales bacterium]